MINRLILASGIAVLMLAGCKETASDTANDVAEARQEAAQDNNDAQLDANKEIADVNGKVIDAQAAYAQDGNITRKKLTIAESDAMVKTAEADYDVAKVAAEGRNKIAQEKCDALSGTDKMSCYDIAKATLVADTSSAAAVRDTQLVDAAYHE